MKVLILFILLMLFGCGIDVKVKDPIDVNHNHRINIEGIVDFCNSYAEEDVQECIDDLMDLFKGVGDEE